jgi:hypothetical protein
MYWCFRLFHFSYCNIIQRHGLDLVPECCRWIVRVPRSEVHWEPIYSSVSLLIPGTGVPSFSTSYIVLYYSPHHFVLLVPCLSYLTEQTCERKKKGSSLAELGYTSHIRWLGTPWEKVMKLRQWCIGSVSFGWWLSTPSLTRLICYWQLYRMLFNRNQAFYRQQRSASTRREKSYEAQMSPRSRFKSFINRISPRDAWLEANAAAGWLDQCSALGWVS